MKILVIGLLWNLNRSDANYRCHIVEKKPT